MSGDFETPAMMGEAKNFWRGEAGRGRKGGRERRLRKRERHCGGERHNEWRERRQLIMGEETGTFVTGVKLRPLQFLPGKESRKGKQCDETNAEAAHVPTPERIKFVKRTSLLVVKLYGCGSSGHNKVCGKRSSS